MSKLSKGQIKQHQDACELLRKDCLSDDERWFVIENWQESATHINSAAGAYFTPADLACDFAIEVAGGHVVDLCAGIGILSFAAQYADREGSIKSITCVEINPDYVAIGRKILPEAHWICADAFALYGRKFDTAISNPPFGNIKRPTATHRFQKGPFDAAIVDLAQEIATWGAFILPKMTGESDKRLQPSCIDADYHADKWRGVSPKVGVYTAEFERIAEAQASLALEVA